MSNGKRHSPLWLVPAAFAASWLLFLLLPGLLGTWHLRASDQLFKLRQRCFGNLRIDPALVHLDVDDASIRALGASVETASRYETIIRLLSDARAAAIAFDYVLLTASDDMVAATRASGRVYYAVAVGPDHAALAESQVWHPAVSGRFPAAPEGVAFATCPELTSAARGVGHITCFPDADGVYRRLPLLIPVKNGFLPSLSLRVVCDYLNVPPERLRVEPGRAIVLRGAEFPDGRRKDIAIPVDEQCRIIVNFSGYETNSLAHFSLAKVIEIAKDKDRFEQLRDDLEDSIVVVADISTAKEVGPVPMERVFHLPGLHSNVMNSILTGQFVRELPLPAAVAVDVVAIALLMLMAVRIRSGRRFVATALVLLAGFLVFYIGLFLYGSLLANGVRTMFGIVFSLMALTVQKYVHEETQRAFLRARFENYFAPALLDKILASRTLLDSCEKKNITVLFSDIAGFTPWSASRSPEEIRGTLNEYFKVMTGIVFRHEGTVDKYMGDGLMVFFGDPVPQEDHPLRAVRAARDMQRCARELAEVWRKEGRLDLRIRIGIHTGDAVVGNLGSVQRVEYTAIGATVNLAQRLEAGAPPGGILISRAVQDRVQGRLPTRPAGRIKAKGFDTEIEVFEVVIDAEA